MYCALRVARVTRDVCVRLSSELRSKTLRILNECVEGRLIHEAIVCLVV